MKRTLKYALSLVITAAAIMPAIAADNFPDVPDNHWAFEALARMKKDGLLVGYPDGLFRGSRPASRYELAVAMHAVYTNLKSVTDGLDSQIKALSDKLNGVASTADLQNLRDALTALQNEVAGMRSYGDDIANLKRMSDTFQKELQSLGVDVEAMKKDLSDISARLSKLEHMKPAVNIGGDVNVLLLAGNSSSGRAGLSTDGVMTGVREDPATGKLVLSSTPKDAMMLEEGAFTFSGTNDTGPKWKGTLVIGNMLDTFGSQSLPGGASEKAGATYSVSQGSGFYQTGGSDIYLQDLSVKFDTSIAGLGFGAEVGRVAYKVSPYIFQRIDNTSYFSNERWDDGMYRMDGGILGFNLGAAKLDIFGGNNTTVASQNSNVLTPLYVNSGNAHSASAIAFNPFDQTIGANLNVPITANGNLDLAYLWLGENGDTQVDGAAANRLAIFGGDLKFNFGRLSLSGGGGASNIMENGSNVNTSNNTEWHGMIGYDGGKWGLSGGYRSIDAAYLAPGDWGRLGIIRNPTNIQGFQVNGHIDLSPAFTLSAGGEFDKGLDNNFAPFTNFNTNTTINTWNVGLTYRMNSNLSVMLGYEDDEFDKLADLPVAYTNNDSTYRWTTFGIGYSLSDTSKLTIQYQLSDVTNDFAGMFSTSTPTGRYTGGLLSGQLSIKF